jgi:serine/threonine-protein kinase
VRRLNSLDAKAVPGAAGVQGPFFSPDGQWIAFFTAGHLQKVFLAGGGAVKIGALPGMFPVAHGGSWGDDGTIVFETGGRLWRVSAHGGTPEPITVDGSFLWPQLLPGSRTVLLTGALGHGGEKARDGIWLLSLDTGQLRQILPEGGIARYVRSGHVVYASKGSLFAAPFDLGNAQLAGSATPVVQGAMMGLPEEERIAHFTASETGTLAYLGGPLLEGQRTLAWVDRQGSEQVLPLESRRYNWPRLSPDGSRVALSVVESSPESGRSSEDVWVYDLARQILTRVTSDPAADARPLWTPDGERVIFQSFRDGPLQSHLYSQPVAATRAAERLTKEPNPDRRAWWISPDGKQLLVTQAGGSETHLVL